MPGLRLVLLMLVAIVVAFGGGAWSAQALLARFEGQGVIAIGPWRADRMTGSPAADPYSRARSAKDGNLTLGLGEGLAFRAATDSDGRPLSADCTYRVEGPIPLARLYTLTAYRPDGRLALPRQSDRPSVLVSSRLMRDDANAAPIVASAVAQPGNWLSLPGDGGPVVLALSLYDTPASSSAGTERLALPTIDRTGCTGRG
ncbi:MULTISPECIES: DUF1214 domain-containing protein [Aureimonas]|uniref:DUF1214 domain-containing protein n=1 Tax=Aureimonas TaxID=414371 RepID=UPI001FEFA84D|nr:MULTISPECIES: DUF1214 domain-containing protein [Aureimonas]